MGTIWEILLEVLGEIFILALFIYPGAFIRWVAGRCRQPFKEVLMDNRYDNGMIGLLMIVGGGLMLIQVFS